MNFCRRIALAGAKFSVLLAALSSGFTFSLLAGPPAPQQNRILHFTVSPTPSCTNQMSWYLTNGTYIGSHLRCCYQMSLSWGTVTGRTYQVVYRTYDTTGTPGRLSEWNACSPPIAGTGSNVTFSSGAPEPALAFYSVEEW
jgi:hypothetical protein